MDKVILISHGRLAEEMKKSVEMIIGKKENIYACGLLETENITQFELKLKEIVDTFETNHTVFIFADLYGGSPCNTCIKAYMESSNIEVISGMNMAMIVSVMLEQGHDAQTLIHIGKESIINVKKKYLDMSVLEADE
ncbi:MAG: PTS sugar transporter subunit IIA [Breznakia sp.]